MRINEILTTKEFPESTTSRLDLELLLTETLHQSRSFLYANPEYVLTKEQETVFQKLYKRRLQGEPIAYILGKKEFWSLELIVNNKVLIPRPETEILVEIVLEKLNKTQATVADLGTGSGAIALAIVKECPEWNIVATDVSEEVLFVAKDNAERLQLQNIKFYCGDWCSALPKEKFDAIVCNPPYIAKDDPHLFQGGVKYEPKLALEAGDGFTAIRKIIKQAKNKLKKEGLLIFEHSYNQSEMTQRLLCQEGYQKITPYKDLAKIERVVAAIL